MLAKLLAQLLPPACPLCLQTFPPGWQEPFCRNCLAEFKALPPARCSCCSLPFVSTAVTEHLCSRCIKSPPSFRSVYTVGCFQGTLRKAIHHLKFNHRVNLDRPLANQLYKALSQQEYDLIVPVPIHRRRLQERCYNQAVLLARELSRVSGIPCVATMLAKIEDTVPQQELSARERVRNLDQVFRVRERLAGERVLLVDDVMTTGSTARACSSVLLQAGAAAVDVAVIGRA
jgi:ComF family protein